MTQQPPRGRFAFISLGCPKNLVDSERMLGLLRSDSYQLVSDPVGTDFVVINTCGFIQEARDESLSVIDEMIQMKREGKTRGVIVTGCLAERQKQLLLAERPEIDCLAGVFSREQITKLADRLLGDLDQQRTVFRPAPIRALDDRDRLRITARHYAYLKISEGCDRLCSFCSIPKMRGKHVSKPIEQVVLEAQQLAEDGVRELIVVAQDTTYYGIDLYGEPRLADLLRELECLPVDWIRPMYFYPMYIDDGLIDTMATSQKILPYIDLPLQHINDGVLKRMARRVNRQQTEDLLHRLRDRIPGLALRTTLITGFPGETEAAFAELVAFVRRQQFERLGVFPYSHEQDTPSHLLSDHLPQAVREHRRDQIMEIQQGIVFAANQAQIGQTRPVIVDRPVPEERRAWVGRTTADAPDVDGLVFVTENKQHPLAPGVITNCEIVATQQYDLVGVAVGKPW